MSFDLQFFRFCDYSYSSRPILFSDFSDYTILPIVLWLHSSGVGLKSSASPLFDFSDPPTRILVLYSNLLWSQHTLQPTTILEVFFFLENALKRITMISTAKNSISYSSSSEMLTNSTICCYTTCTLSIQIHFSLT